MRKIFLVAGALAGLLGGESPLYDNKTDLLLVRDTLAATARPVKTAADWALRRGHILANMERVMGEFPRRPRLAPRYEVAAEADIGKSLRRLIWYEPEDGDRVPAYLFLPKSPGRHRAVLALHQTTRIGKAEPAGLGGYVNLHYGHELAERGYVVLAPDYPNFGDYTYDPYAHGYVSATMKGIWNHTRAVDLLASLPEVDPARIGVIGHSLGGHNSLFAAAFDERLKAVVTSCGFNAFAKYMRGDLTGWSHRGYMPRIASEYGARADRMPFDFGEVLAAIAPRAVYINAPLGDDNFEVSGVKDAVAAARPVFERIFRAGARLVAEHPEAGHDFPLPQRMQAYAFLDRELDAR
jgi:pimeloyl-ACP methyl ester carboxylesterase